MDKNENLKDDFVKMLLDTKEHLEKVSIENNGRILMLNDLIKFIGENNLKISVEKLESTEVSSEH